MNLNSVPLGGGLEAEAPPIGPTWLAVAQCAHRPKEYVNCLFYYTVTHIPAPHVTLFTLFVLPPNAKSCFLFVLLYSGLAVKGLAFGSMNSITP